MKKKRVNNGSLASLFPGNSTATQMSSIVFRDTGKDDIENATDVSNRCFSPKSIAGLEESRGLFFPSIDH